MAPYAYARGADVTPPVVLATSLSEHEEKGSVTSARADLRTRRSTIAASGVVTTITSLIVVTLLHPDLISDSLPPLLFAIPGVAAGLLLAQLVPNAIPAPDNAQQLSSS